MKEAEYLKAFNSKDQLNIDSNTAALSLLKEDLAATVTAFNTIPADNTIATAKEAEKTRKWWHSFFNLKTSANRK